MIQKNQYIKIIIVSFVMITAVISCRSAKSTATQEQISRLDSLVTNKQFTIVSNYANPQMTSAVQKVLNSGLMPQGSGAGNISLIGNHNYLTISGDSITSYLPYFGERQMNVAYGGGDSVICFKGLMKDYKVNKNKNNSYRIDFTAKSENNLENFTVSIKLYSNQQSDVFINSTSRAPISYQGEIKKRLPQQLNNF